MCNEMKQNKINATKTCILFYIYFILAGGFKLLNYNNINVKESFILFYFVLDVRTATATVA